MIGYLRGRVVAETGGEVWVEVGGVGYRVRISQGVRQAGSQGVDGGRDVELFIHTAVREDAITLYGFSNLDELKLFELLITVSGVGPKTASGIVARATSAQIESAIANADVKFFSDLPGIGKKSAQRIIVDLKSKIGSLKEMDLAAEAENDPVFEALKNFGFKPAHISEALKSIDSSLPENERIRMGLKLLGKK